jgi:hypothetical protein
MMNSGKKNLLRRVCIYIHAAQYRPETEEWEIIKIAKYLLFT